MLLRVSRTLTPKMRSRCCSIIRQALPTSAYSGISNSPISFVNMPCEEMLSWAKMRVALTSMMNLRKPGKVSAPAEPASTAVVTPRAKQVGSGSTPKWLTPQIHVDVQVDEARGHHVARDIERLACLGSWVGRPQPQRLCRRRKPRLAPRGSSWAGSTRVPPLRSRS